MPRAFTVCTDLHVLHARLTSATTAETWLIQIPTRRMTHRTTQFIHADQNAASFAIGAYLCSHFNVHFLPAVLSTTALKREEIRARLPGTIRPKEHSAVRSCIVHANKAAVGTLPYILLPNSIAEYAARHQTNWRIKKGTRSGK
jgi:hypothetical protein